MSSDLSGEEEEDVQTGLSPLRGWLSNTEMYVCVCVRVCACLSRIQVNYKVNWDNVQFCQPEATFHHNMTWIQPASDAIRAGEEGCQEKIQNVRI